MAIGAPQRNPDFVTFVGGVEKSYEKNVIYFKVW